MESKFHRWWLGCCFAALLLASWVGGFSPAVTAVFIVIYLTGVTLIGPDDAPGEQVDVVAAELVDVVAAKPAEVVAAAVPEPAVAAEVAAEGETPNDTKSSPDVTPADEPKPETPGEEKSGKEKSGKEKSGEEGDAPAITADAEAESDEPADTETVIVYESAAATEQETVIVEDATDSDTEAVVTLVGDEDDALPYPDDFDDEAAAELGERSPA